MNAFLVTKLRIRFKKTKKTNQQNIGAGREAQVVRAPA
jgi:hypothetical protein